MVAWKIGPTFAAECDAANADMNGVAWGILDGVLLFNDDVPQATREAAAAVLAAHDPAAQTDPPTVPYPPGLPAQQPTKQPLPGPK